MTNKKAKEFDSYCSDILNNNKFKELDKELHHGISRYGHSLRVAKFTYNAAKIFRMKNIKLVTRAALLHDFYKEDDFVNDENKFGKLKEHPLIAVENAKKYYNIGRIEENIIKSHMFPISKEVPKYKESWLVTLMDKAVATYEMCCFKFSLILNILLIFVFNLITIQR